MKNFSELLDDYIAARGLNNDHQLAKKLSVSPQYVWKMRHQGKASDEFCLAMAQELCLDAGLVLLRRNALKETGEVGQAWQKLLRDMEATRLFPTIAAVGIGAALFGGLYLIGDAETAVQLSLVPHLFITGISAYMVYLFFTSTFSRNTSAGLA